MDNALLNSNMPRVLLVVGFAVDQVVERFDTLAFQQGVQVHIAAHAEIDMVLLLDRADVRIARLFTEFPVFIAAAIGAHGRGLNFC